MSSSNNHQYEEKELAVMSSSDGASDHAKDAPEDRETLLPQPAVASASAPKAKLSAAMIIPIWIVLSSSVIIYNNYLYNTLQFKYPVFLVTWHLVFAVRPALFTPGFFADSSHRPSVRVSCSEQQTCLKARGMSL